MKENKRLCPRQEKAKSIPNKFGPGRVRPQIMYERRERQLMRKLIVVLYYLVMMMALFTVGLSGVASAQEERFPSKPINLIIGDTPGGSIDMPARALAKATEKVLGQSVITTNTPGAAGTRALGQVLKAKPDGYTLVTLNASAVVTSVTEKLDYTLPADFPPIIQFQTIPLPFAVKKDAPWKTWQEFVKDARGHKQNITVGVFGKRGTNWLTLHQIEKTENLKFVYVPLGAGESAAAILGGHITASSVVSSIVYAKSGELRLLFVFSDQRLKSFPDVPTAKELYGPEGVAFGGGFCGISAPKGLPNSIVTRLHDAFKKGMEDQDFVKAVDSYDEVISYRSPEEFAKLIKSTGEAVREFLKEGR
jgi:tripartite-type tricarboxylate transporter receptor subunit TctC